LVQTKALLKSFENNNLEIEYDFINEFNRYSFESFWFSFDIIKLILDAIILTFIYGDFLT